METTLHRAASSGTFRCQPAYLKPMIFCLDRAADDDAICMYGGSSLQSDGKRRKRRRRTNEATRDRDDPEGQALNEEEWL